MRFKILSGVSGVSRIFTPNGLNASSTALHSAGGGPSMPGLARALGAQRRERIGRDDVLQDQLRHLFGGRQPVVHERRRQQLTFVVVAQLLVERCADALHDRALLLGVDDLRIDHVAAIVHRAISDDFDHAGFNIDVDDGDHGGVGIT